MENDIPTNPKTSLTEIAGAIELQTGEFSAYYNRETGAIENINTELLAKIEEDEDIEDSLDHYNADEQDLELAREIANNEKWLPLPSQYDINEYSIMERFCRSRSDPDLRDTLLSAIHGKGAFRRFKDTAERTGVLEQWYKYKDDEIREIARQWCEENGVECG